MILVTPLVVGVPMTGAWLVTRPAGGAAGSVGRYGAIEAGGAVTVVCWSAE